MVCVGDVSEPFLHKFWNGKNRGIYRPPARQTSPFGPIVRRKSSTPLSFTAPGASGGSRLVRTPPGNVSSASRTPPLAPSGVGNPNLVPSQPLPAAETPRGPESRPPMRHPLRRLLVALLLAAILAPAGYVFGGAWWLAQSEPHLRFEQLLVPRLLDVTIAAWLLAVGTSVGSFLNVVAWRLPRGKSISGRSHCPRCHDRLRARDNIPVLGWLLLAGRCRTCRLPISARYPDRRNGRRSIDHGNRCRGTASVGAAVPGRPHRPQPAGDPPSHAPDLADRVLPRRRRFDRMGVRLDPLGRPSSAGGTGDPGAACPHRSDGRLPGVDVRSLGGRGRSVVAGATGSISTPSFG